MPVKQAVKPQETGNTEGGRSLALELVRASQTNTSKASLVRAIAALDLARASVWLRQNSAQLAKEMTPVEATALVADMCRMAASTRDYAAAFILAETMTAATQYATESAIESLAPLLEPADRARLLAPVANPMVHRHGGSSSLLMVAAEGAIAQNDFKRAHELLSQCSRRATTPAQVQQVERLRARMPQDATATARIALLSSFTTDALGPFIRAECQALRIAPELYVAPFNSWEREMRDPGSRLFSFGPDTVFLLVAFDDLMPLLSGAADLSEVDAAAEATALRILETVRSFRQQNDTALVIHLIDSVYTDQFVAAGSNSRATILRNVSTRVADELAALPDVFLRGPDRFNDDPKLRHLARMRVPADALQSVAQSYMRFVAAWKGLSRKCVVLDLDNTMWGGVVGEDGPGGIRLSNATPGSEYVEFQNYLKGLIDRGLVLAIASKNNEADALEVIRNHDAMVLREEDFVAMRINWQPKPDNIRSIAEELSIGLDAMVFVDDNPDERELMRQTLPQVLTVELPKDAALYRKTLENLPELQVLRVTDEDKQRTQLYRARRQREVAKSEATSLTDFLATLDIRVDIGPATAVSTARVHQLFQRTNQFNLTTRRYDMPSIEARRTQDNYRIYTLRARDRFSDHELVAAAMVATGSGSWHIENLVLSCRVIGYGIESAMLSAIADDARAHGARTLTGDFVPSAKNAPAKNFYEQHGFVSGAEAGDAELWSRSLDESTPTPEWITVTRSHGA